MDVTSIKSRINFNFQNINVQWHLKNRIIIFANKPKCENKIQKKEISYKL